MVQASGQQTAWGYGPEITWATPVTPSRWLEIRDESLKLSVQTLQSSALRAGARNARQGSRRRRSRISAAGGVNFELASRGFSGLMQMITGGTPVITQKATGAYLHEHALGSQWNRSATIQKQIKDSFGDPVGTFTYVGSKVTQAKFNFELDQFITLETTWDAQNELTDIDPAEPSYIDDANLLTFMDVASLTIDDEPAGSVQSASLTVTQALKTDRVHLGSQGLKKQQTDNGFAEITGELVVDFENLDYYNAFVEDAGAALVIRALGEHITGAYDEYVEWRCPEIHFTGESPTVRGAENLSLTVPFEALAPDDNSSALAIDYQTKDATV